MFISRSLAMSGKSKASRYLTRLLSTQERYKIPETEFTAPSYNGPSYKWVSNVRSTRINPCVSLHFRKPLLLHSGRMQWVFDDQGQRYLDLFGGIATISVGHCHPRVCDAAEEQIRTLWHTSNIYMHPKIHEYAYRLTEMLPGDLKVVYFVNSGSEANDLAVMLARDYTNSQDVISMNNCYHGASPLTLGMCGHASWKPKFTNALGIHNLTNPDPYRGPWGGYRDSPVQSDRADESVVKDGVCSSVEKYIGLLKETLQYATSECRLAAFFAESIQGVGGTVQFPVGYLKEAFKLVREHGGLCVSDEVQTGFGRTGEHFWGFQSHGVVPDIVTMAKGMGNGFPLAAVITTPEIASKALSKTLHFNTFGGNPLSTAVGIAVLDAIEEDKTQENSQVVGTYFLKELEKLRSEYEVVGDVRGKGLMIGLELVEDKKGRVPLNSQTVGDLYEFCKDNGVLYGRGGRFSNVLRIKPPMCISREDVDFAVDVLKNALDKYTT